MKNIIKKPILFVIIMTTSFPSFSYFPTKHKCDIKKRVVLEAKSTQGNNSNPIFQIWSWKKKDFLVGEWKAQGTLTHSIYRFNQDGTVTYKKRPNISGNTQAGTYEHDTKKHKITIRLEGESKKEISYTKNSDDEIVFDKLTWVKISD